jgi:hypothetical protein
MQAMTKPTAMTKRTVMMKMKAVIPALVEVLSFLPLQAAL